MRCVGFNRKLGTSDGWAPCPLAAVRKDHYWTKHRNGLDSALLGLMRRERNPSAFEEILRTEAEMRREALRRELTREKKARAAEKSAPRRKHFAAKKDAVPKKKPAPAKAPASPATPVAPRKNSPPGSAPRSKF